MREYPEDDWNQSYVLDVEANDIVVESKKKKGKKKKTARDKKRELETKYGGSKDSSVMSNDSRTKISWNNSRRTGEGTDETADMYMSGLSSGSGSLTFMDLEMGNNSGSVSMKDKKKKARKARERSKLHHSRSDDLAAYFESDATITRKFGGSRGTLDSSKRKVRMRDTERLLRAPPRPTMARQDSGTVSGNSTQSNSVSRRQDSTRGFGGPSSASPNKGKQRHPSNRGRSMDRSNSSRGLPPSVNMRGQSSDQSVGSRNGMNRSNSTRGQSMDRSNSTRNGGLFRENSFTSQNSRQIVPVRGRGMSRAKSAMEFEGRRARSMDRSDSMSRRPKSIGGDLSDHRPKFKRGKSMDRSRPPQTMPGGRGLSRSRSASMDTSRRSRLSRSNSNASILSERSISNARILHNKDGQTVVLVPVSKEEAKRLPKGKKYVNAFGKKIEVEETPPKSLVIIWIIVFAELGFDLGTTIIAFRSLLNDDQCCGHQMQLGFIPLTVTTPFFFLLFAELGFLFRAMILTLWPSMMTGGEETDGGKRRATQRTGWWKWFCCILRFKASVVLQILNVLVLLNPFFGCVIAWMLLYQSDKTESFIVLGLEGGSIILHFLSVWLEGSCKTFCAFLFHCIPLIPFLASISLILFYLKQGGVCYIVENRFFYFAGCEICPDGFPPDSYGNCTINGTSFALGGPNGLFDIDFTTNDLDSLKNDIVARSNQGTFCANDYNMTEPHFCFFKYT